MEMPSDSRGAQLPQAVVGLPQGSCGAALGQSWSSAAPGSHGDVLGQTWGYTRAVAELPQVVVGIQPVGAGAKTVIIVKRYDCFLTTKESLQLHH